MGLKVTKVCFSLLGYLYVILNTQLSGSSSKNSAHSSSAPALVSKRSLVCSSNSSSANLLYIAPNFLNSPAQSPIESLIISLAPKS